MRLEARTPPQETAIRALSHVYPSGRWRRVLPACLNRPGWALREATRRDHEHFARSCLDKPLADSLAEVAADCLGGASENNPFESATVLLLHLATHPLDRSPGVGALVAALCQKERAL